jgi:hypothetical protein
MEHFFRPHIDPYQCRWKSSVTRSKSASRGGKRRPSFDLLPRRRIADPMPRRAGTKNRLHSSKIVGGEK